MKKNFMLFILIILIISLLIGCSKKDELSFEFKDMNSRYISKIDDDFRKSINDYFETIAAYHTTYSNGDKENALILLGLNDGFSDKLINQLDDYDSSVSDEQFKIVGELLEFHTFVIEKKGEDIGDIARDLATGNNQNKLNEDDQKFLDKLKNKYQTFITKYYE